MYMYNRANYYRAKKQYVFARNSFIVLMVLLLTLPFHYVTGHFQIIPKTQWGFAHTIVTERDIEDALYEYNMAGKTGKEELIQQSWVQKVIYERSIVHSNTN